MSGIAALRQSNSAGAINIETGVAPLTQSLMRAYSSTDGLGGRTAPRPVPSRHPLEGLTPAAEVMGQSSSYRIGRQIPGTHQSVDVDAMWDQMRGPRRSCWGRYCGGCLPVSTTMQCSGWFFALLNLGAHLVSPWYSVIGVAVATTGWAYERRRLQSATANYELCENVDEFRRQLGRLGQTRLDLQRQVVELQMATGVAREEHNNFMTQLLAEADARQREHDEFMVTLREQNVRAAETVDRLTVQVTALSAVKEELEKQVAQLGVEVQHLTEQNEEARKQLEERKQFMERVQADYQQQIEALQAHAEEARQAQAAEDAQLNVLRDLRRDEDAQLATVTAVVSNLKREESAIRQSVCALQAIANHIQKQLHEIDKEKAGLVAERQRIDEARKALEAARR